MDAPPKSEYTVATIGFDAHEKKVLQSMFGISAGRSPSFAPYAFSREKGADLVLLDHDNPRALNGWAAYLQIHPGAADMPIVAVSRRSVEAVSYVLRRPVVATRLLGTLERVASDELGFVHAHAFADATGVMSEAEPVTRTYSKSLTSMTLVSATSAAALGGTTHTATGSTTWGDVSTRTTPPGSGSTLPDAATAGTATGSEAPASHVRALVVDDSMPVRIQMRIALGGVADEVDFAETGEEAQELLAKNDYDIIFLDVILPGIDGYEVCRSVKSNPATNATPVIMLTGSSSPADRVRGRLAGCDTYLIKPVRKAVFEEVVRDYLTIRTAA